MDAPASTNILSVDSVKLLNAVWNAQICSGVNPLESITFSSAPALTSNSKMASLLSSVAKKKENYC